MSLFQPRTLEGFDRGVIPIINENFRKLWRMLTGGLDFSNAASAGLLQSWQDSNEANLDSSNPMSVDMYLPADTRAVHKVLLRIRKKQYRADSTTATSGGGSTSGSGGGQTSSSGGGGSSSSGGGGTTDTFSGNISTQSHHLHTLDTLLDKTTTAAGGHNHGISPDTALAIAGGGSVTFVATTDHDHGYGIWDRADYAGEHTHTFPDHMHLGPVHTHSMPDHTHTVAAHTHTTPAHTHSLTYGISLTALPGDAAFTISVNGVDRTVALGGPFAGDVVDLDITQWFVIGQWNPVVIGCGAGILVRATAQIFIQAFINPIGRLDVEE